MQRVLSLTMVLLLGSLTLHLQPLLAGENEKARPATLTTNEQQRHFLAAAKVWKVEVTDDYPHDPKEKRPISIQEDCECLLRRAGWEVGAANATVVLRIGLKGTAKSERYGLRYGIAFVGDLTTHYSGAEVAINAAITTADSPPETILMFSAVKGVEDTPSSISSSYPSPKDAPYNDAYKKCCDFHTQLLSVIHAVKGAKATYDGGNAADSEFRAALFTFIEASADRSFVPLLVDDLVGGRGQVEAFANCLGALGDARAVEPLCMSLVDKQGNVWEPAARALGKLGDAKAIPLLRTALLGANSNPKPAASTLRDLKWHPTTAKEKVIYWLAFDEPNNVKQLKDEAVPILIELFDAEKWAAPAAARLLGELKEASAVGSLSRALLGGKASNSWERRSLRLAAAKALSEISGQKTVEPLAMALMSDAESDVRKECTTGLGKAGGEAAVKSLAQALASDTDSDVRTMCAKELGKAGGEATVKSLAKALASDRDGGVRTACATELGKAGGKAAVGVLIKAVVEDKDDAVVMAAQDALGQLKDRGAVDCLLKSLNHRNSSVRTHAVCALRLIGDSRAVPAIGDRLKEETDQQTRQAMVELLSELDVQPGVLPFEARLGLLAKQRKWEDIRTFLNEQSTDKVIESLKLEDELVNKVARFILAQRTGKYDLQTYNDWKQWWKLNGGKPSTGETAAPRVSEPQR